MSKLDRVLRAGVVLGVVGFAIAMVDLLVGRLGHGDVYPAYSSYRADPMGTKALYDSLSALPGLSVARNIEALERLGSGKGKTMILVGEGGNRFDRSQDANAVEGLERFVNGGGRLVIALVHERGWASIDWDRPTSRPARSKSRPASGRASKPSSRPAAASTSMPASASAQTAPADDEFEAPRRVELGARWKFAVAIRGAPEAELHDKKNTRHGPAQKQAHLSAPIATEGDVTWMGGLHLEPKESLWKVIYRTDAGAAVMERAMGLGSLVLCSDSFFLSNEGLRHRHSPKLLSWLLGSSATAAIFDETHLGVGSEITVMGLMRRHNLETALAALAVVAGLYLWRSLSHLGPVVRPEGAIDTGAVSGRDSTSALVSLLRRAIRRGDLLAMCIREWSRPAKAASAGATPAETNDARTAALRTAAAAAAAGDERTLVSAYQTMCRILAERK